MRQTLLWWLACAAMAAQAAQPQLIPWLGADGRYGYVNDAGQMRIPPRYDDVRQFFDGRAAARLGGRWGYLDTGGHWVVAPRYTEAKDFGPDGKATALIHTDAIKVGSGFLAMTMVKQHYHYEQLDRAGQVVKSWDTDNGPMGPPRAGSTMVPTPIAALVRSGKYLFGADLASLYALTGSGCGVQGGICKMHLFDATGQQVSSRAFYLTRSQEFGDGRMAMLCADNGKHGYVDEKGALVIPCLYDGAGLFRAGLAIVRQRGKGSGVIDRDGRQVIGLVYDDLRYPKDGYLVARRKGAWGIIDARSGRAVVPLTHANLDDVAILDAAGTPVFAVRESSGLCLFARNGKRLACGVGLAEDAGSGLIAVFVPGPRGKYHGFWGALDAAGRQVIKVRYDTAPSFHDGLARVSRAGHAFYIDLHGREYVAADVLPLH